MQNNKYTVEAYEMTMPRDTRVKHHTVIVASNRHQAFILAGEWAKELRVQKGVDMGGLSVRRQIKISTKSTYHSA